jgi:fructose-1,6-bisphosphatase/inositol monophosphatase family enzyme
MLTARGSRSVDAAAAQLVAREAGAVVQFEGYTLDDAPLSIEARYRLIAGLDDEMVATLGEGLPPVEDPPS